MMVWIIAGTDAMPRPSLQGVDWFVIGSYFVTLLLIGFYYRRFASRGLEEFFLAGRRNSGWANGVSYAAVNMNADVAPGYSGVAVATGLFVCWFYLSRFGLALFIGAVLFAVFWRRLGLFTTPEFYELRFGGKASSVIRTWVALRSSLIAMVAWTGTGLLAIYKIAEPVLGVSKATAIAMVVPIVLIYVSTAGLSGVVATAGVQSLIMVIGSAMLCGIVLYAMGGPVGLAVQLSEVAGQEVLQVFPPADHWFFPIAAAVAWMIGTSIGYGGDTAPLGGAMEGQMVLSSRNTREASKMYVVAAVTLFLLLLLVTLPALGAIIDWPELRDPNVDREKAYGLLMAKYLPPGMLGLLFVVMLAAVMSTVGSNLIFGSQVLVNDVYRRHLKPHQTDRHYLWIGRGAALMILTMAIVVAFKVDLIFYVAAFMVAASAAELPANWAQWWWWRFNQWGRLAASFGGVMIPVLVWFVLPTQAWPWWERTYLVIATNTAFWIVVTLLTPPDSPAVLDRFYRKGRPLGAWGPMRRRAEAQSFRETRGSGVFLILAGFGLAVLGAVSVAALISALSSAYVGRFGIAACTAVLSFMAGGVFLLIYGRYLDRLESWAESPAAGSTYQQPSAVPLRTQAQPSKPENTAFMGTPATQEPVRTSVIVALATAVYGPILVIAGLIGQGTQMTHNLIAGGAFMLAAAIVWHIGRVSGKVAPPALEIASPESVPGEAAPISPANAP